VLVLCISLNTAILLEGDHCLNDKAMLEELHVCV
jgi:hypothetical protein